MVGSLPSSRLPRRRANSSPCRNVSNTNFVSSITASPLLVLSQAAPDAAHPRLGSCKQLPSSSGTALSATLEGRCLQRSLEFGHFESVTLPRDRCGFICQRYSFYH